MRILLGATVDIRRVPAFYTQARYLRELLSQRGDILDIVVVSDGDSRVLSTALSRLDARRVPSEASFWNMQGYDAFVRITPADLWDAPCIIALLAHLPNMPIVGLAYNDGGLQRVTRIDTPFAMRADAYYSVWFGRSWTGLWEHLNTKGFVFRVDSITPSMDDARILGSSASHKIAIYAPQISAGGVQRFIDAQLTWWLDSVDDDYQFTLVCPTRDTARALIQFKPHRRLLTMGPRDIDWFTRYSDLFDLVYLPSTSGVPLPSRKWDVPTVATLHDLSHLHTDSWGDNTANVMSRIAGWSSLVDMIVFSSEYVRDQIVMQGVPRGKTHRIYPNVLTSGEPPSIEVARTVSDRYGLPDEFVLCPNAAVRHKNHSVVIDAFSRLKSWGRKLPLVLVGPLTGSLKSNAATNHDFHKYLQRLIRDGGLKVGSDIFTLDYIPDDDMDALYVSASALVTATVSEAGVNGSVAQAMWSRCPVICTRIPQFTESLGEHHVRMFTPGDSVELCHILRQPFDLVRAEAAYQWISRKPKSQAAYEYLELFKRMMCS